MGGQAAVASRDTNLLWRGRIDSSCHCRSWLAGNNGPPRGQGDAAGASYGDLDGFDDSGGRKNPVFAGLNQPKGRDVRHVDAVCLSGRVEGAARAAKSTQGPMAGLSCGIDPAAGRVSRSRVWHAVWALELCSDASLRFGGLARADRYGDRCPRCAGVVADES